MGEQNNIVAKGRVIDFGGDGVKIHGLPLGENNYKVMVESIFQPKAIVPFPTDEVNFLFETTGGVVAWPSSLVIFDMEV